MLGQFTSWLLDLVKQFFTDLWQFVVDVAIELVDMVLGAVVVIVSAIGVPQFMTEGLSTLWGQLPSGVVFIASELGVPAALGIIGAGYAFRIARKVATLFQW